MSTDGARCACCQSTEITDRTRFDPSEGHSRVWFKKLDAQSGWLSADEESFTITRARVCLSCGHVMWGLDSAALRELRERIGKLAPLPES
jgi:hypothetical protein